MPQESEYKNDKYFKKNKVISGDMYWQGKVIKLGCRKEEVDPNDGDSPKVGNG